eukprot:Phypoly_transcript_02841.p1 GENE.Phypoly_transcript_02841~~Phypoly_transcript_02841.p1  ORF type:complete len:845 (+),score=100.18 Phypoly_transcript_02841:109-2643(+)
MRVSQGMLITITLFALFLWVHSEWIEPYPYLNGGAFTGPQVPYSCDPLVRYQWNSSVNATELQVYFTSPVSAVADNPASFGNLASLTTENVDVLVSGPGNIIMDFGVEHAAWLEFDSTDILVTELPHVYMSISEYNQPGIEFIGWTPFPNKTAVPVQHGNTYRLELNNELYEGVRFGWIHIMNTPSQPFHITGLRLVCQIKPTNYGGSFSTSNFLLSQIWWTGAYTVKLNLMSDYIGSELMDRGDRFSFTGDAHAAQAAALVAFEDYSFILNNLERTADYDNGYPSYSLYWVLSLLDYFKYTSDVTTLISYIPLVEQKFQAAFVNGANSLVFYGWDERLGAGYEMPNNTETARAYGMLLIRACNQFALAMKAINRTDLYANYSTSAYTLMQTVRETNPNWYTIYGMHASAEAINTQLTTDEENMAIYKLRFNDDINLCSRAPFNMYFILQALGNLGNIPRAVEAVLQCWGGQIEIGATTFWEVYSPQWNAFIGKNDPVPNGQNSFTSLCHPWAAGVTHWLSENILGIKPDYEPFSYTIIPQVSLQHGVTQISGSLHTPLGKISVTWDAIKGAYAITTPKQAKIKLGIPARDPAHEGCSLERVADEFGQIAWENHKEDTGDYIFLTNFGTEYFEYHTSYQQNQCTKNSNSFYEKFESEYPATFLGTDNSTKGNWPAKYGKKGYFMFNYFGKGRDNVMLPTFVQSINWLQNMGWFGGAPLYVHWVSDTQDARALPQNSTSGNNHLSIGALSTNDTIGLYQTFLLNLNISSSQTFQVSLYFVDWDFQARDLVVEMFDLETKNIITPFQRVCNFTGGIYYTWTYSSSIRFRFSQIRGGNSVVSAVFFD